MNFKVDLYVSPISSFRFRQISSLIHSFQLDCKFSKYFIHPPEAVD